MRAGRLRRYTCQPRQLSSGQGHPAHQGVQDRGAGWVANQLTDLGQVGVGREDVAMCVGHFQDFRGAMLRWASK